MRVSLADFIEMLGVLIEVPVMLRVYIVNNSKAWYEKS